MNHIVYGVVSSLSPVFLGEQQNTPTGSPVVVDLPGAVVTFTNVTGAGITSVSTSAGAPCGSLPFPYNAKSSTHHITTTATYTGPVTVGISYIDSGMGSSEGMLRLFHCDGTGWTDVTTSVDTVNNIIYGQDSTLSWWLIGGPWVPGGGGGYVPGGGGVPIFPNIYIGIAAALGAGIMAFFIRRRLVRQL